MTGRVVTIVLLLCALTLRHESEGGKFAAKCMFVNL